MSSRGPVGNSDIKPNMLFFRQTSVQKLQSYIVNLYANLELQCLQHYFNVTVIDYDCDYNNVCDKFEPEICFFELGTEMPVSLKIDNIKNNNSVPKLGFIKQISTLAAEPNFFTKGTNTVSTTFLLAATYRRIPSFRIHEQNFILALFLLI